MISKEVCICLMMITVIFAITCVYLYNKIYELENKLSAQKAESEYMKDLLRTVWQNANTPTMYFIKKRDLS